MGTNEFANEFKLFQNYPNPFNPKTVLSFQLPVFSHVKLIVYDILGREAVTLVNEEMEAGSHEVAWDASQFSSGIYFYKLVAGEFTETRKMLLVR
jgi:hypothetical protein